MLSNRYLLEIVESATSSYHATSLLFTTTTIYYSSTIEIEAMYLVANSNRKLNGHVNYQLYQYVQNFFELVGTVRTTFEILAAVHLLE